MRERRELCLRVSPAMVVANVCSWMFVSLVIRASFSGYNPHVDGKTDGILRRKNAA